MGCPEAVYENFEKNLNKYWKLRSLITYPYTVLRSAKGHYGQFIVIIPSYELIILRIGMTLPPAHFDLDEMLKGILDALEP